MAGPPTSFGTAFAQAGFSFDANLSPNNQAFGNAVVAVMARNGAIIGTAASPFIHAGTLSTSAFANPTNKVSGTATNGTSTLAMRSDAAPALDWAQSPAWTGTHNFQGGVILGTGTYLPWGGGLGTYQPALQFGEHAGLFPDAPAHGLDLLCGAYYNGTNYIFTGTQGGGGTSTAMLVSYNIGLMRGYYLGTGTYSGTAALVQVFQLGGTVAPTAQAYGPVKGALVDLTPDASTVTLTQTGGTSAPTVTANWCRVGNLAMMQIPAFAAMNSNSTALTFTGVPAAIQPARTQLIRLPSMSFINGGAQLTASSEVDAELNASSGTITLLLNGSASGWTNSATNKGLNNVVITLWWPLN